MKQVAFNTGWQCNGAPVTLPHDAMIREPRSAGASDGGHGYFPGGVYTYEKIFTPPADWEGQRVLIEFEGVYRDCTVRLNGRELGGHHYGYTTFALPLEGLRCGQSNTLTVVADNSKLPNSRWYTGSGIYRPVWIYLGKGDHVAYRGVRVTTLSHAPARVRVEVTALTPEGGPSAAPIRVEILDKRQVVAAGWGPVCELTLPDAKLWSAETPYLYTCRVTVGQDVVEERFGVRTLQWSNRGFLVNGRDTLLRGGCIHHDSGILGAATYDESEWRRVRIMKQAGFNAIRMAHNPASRALLEACDALGMYVMDETFDMWYNRKTRYDYGLQFEHCWREDTAEMVRRDYNHPSVILYSIGNEVAEPAQPKGVQIGREMVELVHSLDATRPVTCGVNLMIIARAAKGKGIYQDGNQTVGQEAKQQKEGGNASLMFNIMASFMGSGMNKSGNSPKVDRLASPLIDALDIAGYNYGSGRYPLEGKQHPDRIIFGSETFPGDIEKNWKMVEKYPYLIGDFMWAGWDYLGEAGIGAWSYKGGMPFNRPYPWVLGGSGVIDITGKPDGSCRYAAVVWGQGRPVYLAVRPVNHPGVRPSKSAWRTTNAIESWAWTGCEGNPALAEVYAQGERVTLLLNGKRVGSKKLRHKKALFRLRYRPGVLTAVSYDAAGRELGRAELRSAEGEVAISLSPEQKTARPGQVVFVPVELTGENGVTESNADRTLRVQVEGGELLAFGSANPCTAESYHTGQFTTYYGRALAAVRVQGPVVITATDGKVTGTARIACTLRQEGEGEE